MSSARAGGFGEVAIGFNNLSHAGGADGMAVANQAASRIDREGVELGRAEGGTVVAIGRTGCVGSVGLPVEAAVVWTWGLAATG